MADETTTADIVKGGDRGLNRVLAWVGIIAGTVFIVGAVFFSGYALGAGSGGFHRTWHGGCPMMGGDRDDMGGPGRMGPGGMMPPSPPPGPPPAPRS